jgi:hypothetical protein
MPEDDLNAAHRIRLRTSALSRWESEGGAGVEPRCPAAASDDAPLDALPLTNVELVQLRIRVIALENLVISLLAQAPQGQLARAREMAAYISPRPGYTPHPLTIRAALEMLSLVDRSGRFRSTPTS